MEEYGGTSSITNRQLQFLSLLNTSHAMSSLYKTESVYLFFVPLTGHSFQQIWTKFGIRRLYIAWMVMGMEQWINYFKVGGGTVEL